MKPGCSHRAVVWIIVGTLAFVAATYVTTLCACAVFGINPPEKVLDNLKDVGIYALGGLSTLLAQTRSQQEPQNVNVTNPPSQPIPVEEKSEP